MTIILATIYELKTKTKKKTNSYNYLQNIMQIEVLFYLNIYFSIILCKSNIESKVDFFFSSK